MNLNPILKARIALLLLLVSLSLSSCSLPQVKAEDRLFLDLSVDFLGEYRLPKTTFEGTPVGGLSGITYDRQRDRLYAISDDRSDRAPARFYTLKLTPIPAPSPTTETATTPSATLIPQIEIESVTPLTDPDGNPYAKGTVDPEGIALSPRQTLYISSEGVSRDQIPPFVNEYDLQTGQYRSRLPIPQRFLPQTLDDQPAGVQDNRGFEALTLSAVGFSGGQQLEPFRIFTAPEFGLLQDQPPQPEDSATALPPTPIRFLHYLVGVGNNAPSEIISEHLYDLDLPPEGTRDYGLSELLVLDQAGHFLSLERSFGLSGFGAKLFQIATGGATDTSTLPNLRDSIEGITPIRKELLLDLTTLGLPLDNLEGMTLGPQLPDGSQSLLLASDDNFNDIQVTQFLLFRLKGWRSQ